MLNLKSIRKDKGLTGEMVCRMAGLSVSALSMIETGKRRPSVDVAKRIAAALDFDWTRFYADDGNTPTISPEHAALAAALGIPDARRLVV